MNLVGQKRRITPAPTVHRQSLSTLAHHRRVSAFPECVRQLACTRRRGGPRVGRAASKQGGREEGESSRP